MDPKRKPNTNKYLSHRPVTCGECSKVITRIENLQPHFDYLHEGRPAFEKNQRKIDLCSAPIPRTKRKASENENLSSPTSTSTQSDEHALQLATTSTSDMQMSVSPPPSLSPSPAAQRSEARAIQQRSNEDLIGQMRVLLEKLELNVCPSREKEVAVKAPTMQSPLQSPLQSPFSTLETTSGSSQLNSTGGGEPLTKFQLRR